MSRIIQNSNWLLVHKNTQVPVRVGEVVEFPNVFSYGKHQTVVITGARSPKSSPAVGNFGRVETKDGTYMPNAFGLVWIRKTKPEAKSEKEDSNIQIRIRKSNTNGEWKSVDFQTYLKIQKLLDAME